MFKKTLSLLSIFLLYGCITANAADMVIVAKLYPSNPSACDFGIYEVDGNERPIATFWFKLITTLKNEYQRGLFEQINNLKISEGSIKFKIIDKMSQEINDIERELGDDPHGFDKYDILEQKEKQLFEFLFKQIPAEKKISPPRPIKKPVKRKNPFKVSKTEQLITLSRLEILNIS